MKPDEGPGVPEALPRTVQGLGRTLDPGTLDRLWLFPPMIRGRKEWGLVAVSRYAGEVEGDDRRALYTVPYAAERTGKGLSVTWSVEEQGAAPPDRFPRVMDGVVRRAGGELGDPREVEIGGEAGRFQELLEELGTHLLEPEPEPEPATAAVVAEPEPPASLDA